MLHHVLVHREFVKKVNCKIWEMWIWKRIGSTNSIWQSRRKEGTYPCVKTFARKHIWHKWEGGPDSEWLDKVDWSFGTGELCRQGKGRSTSYRKKTVTIKRSFVMLTMTLEYITYIYRESSWQCWPWINITRFVCSNKSRLSVYDLGQYNHNCAQQIT